MNQRLALVWSIWRLAFPPLPLSLFQSHSLSSHTFCISPYHPPLPPWLPSLCPPACCLQTHSSFLSGGWSSCLLTGACCWRLRGPETRIWQPANLFVCFGSLVSLSSSSVCVHACLRAKIGWGSNRVECWMCFKYLLNHTWSSACVCVPYMRQDISTYKCTHIDSYLLIFSYPMLKQGLFHSVCVCVHVIV